MVKLRSCEAARPPLRPGLPKLKNAQGATTRRSSKVLDREGAPPCDAAQRAPRPSPLVNVQTAGSCYSRRLRTRKPASVRTADEADLSMCDRNWSPLISTTSRVGDSPRSFPKAAIGALRLARAFSGRSPQRDEPAVSRDRADLSDRSTIYGVIDVRNRMGADIHDALQHLSQTRPFEANSTAQNGSRHLPHVFRRTGSRDKAAAARRSALEFRSRGCNVCIMYSLPLEFG